jgi:hypothetical protein
MGYNRMRIADTSRLWRRFRWPVLCAGTTFFLVPFLYLTSLALLLSAYVHGCSVPSRSFLKNYAIPSNTLAGLPGIGRIYSGYFDLCVVITRADYEPQKSK